MPDELNGAPAEQVSQSTTAPEVTSQAPPDFRQRLSEIGGYDLEGWDDEKLANAIHHGLQRAGRADQLEPIAAQASRYLEHAADIDEFLANRERESKAKQPAEQEKPNRWKPPVEYDPQMENYTRFDQDLKRWVLTDEASRYVNPSVAEQVNKFKSWERDNALHITRNFPDAVKEAVADLLAEQESKFDKRLGSYTQEMRDLALAQNFLKQNFKEFFQTDQQGNVLVDQSGREAMTPKGQLFDHFVNEARQIGITSTEKVINYAKVMTQAAVSDSEARDAAVKKAAKKEAKAEPEKTEAKTPEERNTQAKESFVRRAIRGSRVANLATSTPEADASALKERRGGPRPNFHEIRKALAEAQN